MLRTELEKMQAGEWYSCLDPELEALRMVARRAVHEHRVLDPDKRGAIAPRLAALFGSVGNDVYIEAPFHCAYGFNIAIGDGAYFNAGCTILDSGSVTIGERTLMGPNVQIYCAEHNKEADLRAAGQEIARPVSIGSDVWIGGGAVVLPGVTIGDRSVIGAGSVITRDVDSGAVVVGNPGRPVRHD
ncbi:sugar O-acetyltransferase [Wenxinia marina]|uniref:Nodulation protein L n=1 Tax=Wenxinia marina DSM 24838 TaxID=1123501 RepID=A0A0D0QEJ8_9RHOB|nr:sugar O-acetyltransferase [Wenxinia marina]KIQ69438.1 Acetyltransferase (isoleucine patch superfamily) [Wenxinia marina DSM 24838]GGL58365.1 maltose O-acetyltransferase [Wenxinia marina]